MCVHYLTLLKKICLLPKYLLILKYLFYNTPIIIIVIYIDVKYYI